MKSKAQTWLISPSNRSASVCEEPFTEMFGNYPPLPFFFYLNYFAQLISFLGLLGGQTRLKYSDIMISGG